MKRLQNILAPKGRLSLKHENIMCDTTLGVVVHGNNNKFICGT